MRHSGAQHLTVELTTAPDQIELVIEDDGQGFDMNHLPSGRFGLIGMNERAKLLGGTLSLASAPGEGTTLTVTIPLDPRL